jgi:hypothetical protein
MEAWKVPSSSQYFRMRSSISGNRGEEGVPDWAFGSELARGYTGVAILAGVDCGAVWSSCKDA